MPARQAPGSADLEQRVTDVLKLARDLGASQAEASASFGTGFSVNVRMREVETIRHQRDQGLGVTVYLGQRRGSASTSDLRAAAIEETVRKAVALARYAAEDPAAGLADPARLATRFPDLDLHHPWDIDPDRAIALATECEAAALAADPRITNSEGASVSTGEGLHVYGNSHGFMAGYRDTEHGVSCAVVGAQDGAMETDYEYSLARDPRRLPPVAVTGAEAGRRTAARLGAVKLSTRTVPVLFPARLARGLFGSLLGAIGGSAQYRRASFLLGQAGQPVFADWIRIDERPHLPGALGSAAFDDEGVATCDRTLIDDGVLTGYLLGSYYARKLGLATTGNAGGAHNLVVRSSGQDFATLLAELGTGFLVGDLMGSGVNPVTGDYSRGAAGFWVEGGAIRHPVTEVTIAGNLRDIYRGIRAIGTDVDDRGTILTGSVLVDRMTIAGT